MRMELVNSGVAVRGVLEVVEARGGPTRGMEPYSFIQRRDVFLSTHARKVVYVTVDPDSVAQPLVLRFTGGGRTHETAVSLRGRFTGQPLILLLTRSNVAPAIPLSYQTPVPVVSAAVSDLPEDPRAFGGVWSVMLYEQSLRGLSRVQRGALTHWLSAGGILVVLGGAHFALYQDPATAALLPVEVTGLKRLNALPELSAQFGGVLEDVLVQNAVPTAGGRVLLAEGGAPVLVEKSHGEGRVVYLALDVGRPPVSDWKGLPALFGEALGAPPPRHTEPWTAWNLQLFIGLLQDFGFTSLRSPMLSLLLALALYAGSLLLWFRYWKAGGPRRRALTLAPAGLVLAWALTGYWYFDRGGHTPDGILISSHGGGRNAVVGRGAGALQCGPVRDPPQGFFLQPRPRPDPARSGAGPRRRGGGVAGAAGGAPAQPRSRSARGMERGAVPAPRRAPFAVAIEWEHSRRTYRIGIANRGTGRLTECWLLIGGRGYRLGDVPPGGRLRRELPEVRGAGEAVEGQEPQPEDVRFDENVRQVLLRRSVFPDGDRTPRRLSSSAG